MKVAAVQLRSDPRNSPDQNIAHALEMAERAARGQVDLIVLPEAISMLCYPDGRTDFTYHNVSEPASGPTTRALANIASSYDVNIVVGLIEERGESIACQNVGLVINRGGKIVGRYEKLHEPLVCRDEQAAGTGADVPVFDLDVATIGVAICWDINFPELFSLLAYKGASIICFPHLIGLPTAANYAVQLRARAIDTATFVIAAGMRDEGSHSSTQDGLAPTCIIDPDGNVVAQASTDREEIVLAELRLEEASPNQVHRDRVKTDFRFDVLAREYQALASERRKQKR